MDVKRNLFIGLIALSLFSGPLLAQMPGQAPPGQGGAQLPQPASPTAEDSSLSGVGIWVAIAAGAVVLIWLFNKPKQRIVPFPVPVPGPKQAGGCAVAIVAGLTLLALAGLALACM
jgi:hypothetical protein